MGKIKFISFFLLSALLFTSCTTKISDIQNNPKEFNDKEVSVKGKVVSSKNAVVLKYFKLEDGTGTIYVITKNDLPDENDKVKVTGNVKQYFKIAGLKLTVIMEEKRGICLF